MQLSCHNDMYDNLLKHLNKTLALVALIPLCSTWVTTFWSLAMGKHKKNRGSRHEKLFRRFTILKSARRCFFHGLEEALQERIKDVCIRPYPFLPIFYIYMDKELIFGFFVTWVLWQRRLEERHHLKISRPNLL